MSDMHTVTVRPMTYHDVEALAQPDAEPVEVYEQVSSAAHGETLTPITLTPVTIRTKTHSDTSLPHRPVHATVPYTGRNRDKEWDTDPTQTVGYRVQCDTADMFGSSSGGNLFTTEEAERSVRLTQGWNDPAEFRHRLRVPDPEGTEAPLTPVYGSQVSTGFVLTGIDADEARTRTEAALRAEFGDTMRPHAKVQSRPVPDRRVNIYEANKERLVAVNVLSAEVSYFMRGGSAYVEDVDPDGPTVSVG